MYNLAAVVLTLVMSFSAVTAGFVPDCRISDLDSGLLVQKNFDVVEISGGSWSKENGKWVYYLNGQRVSGFAKIDGKTYYFNDNGIMQTGWVNLNNRWFWFDASGGMATSWHKIDNKWYFFTDDGIMATGAWSINGKTYIFNDNGTMATGWIQHEGYWYYLNPTGEAKTSGWLYNNNKWYYFDRDGKMVTGSYRVGDKYYLFDGSGAMCSGGWKQYDGSWFYLNSSGEAKTESWLYSDKKWYYFDGEGRMLTGLNEVAGKYYFFNGSGAMFAGGWKQIDNDWYYFLKDGSAVTGWYKPAQYEYYFSDSGVMMHDTVIDGKQLGSDGRVIESSGGPSQETRNYDAGEYSIDSVHSGEGTYYDRETPGAANLDEYEDIYFTAAMNTYDYMNNLAGAYIEITDHNGDKINVLITDRLPEGAKGDIDLLRPAFAEIEPLVTGRMNITWKIIPLPTDDPVSFVWKPESTQWWAQIQVRNHRYPVAKLEYLNRSGQVGS